jgi:hypothetical protein
MIWTWFKDDWLITRRAANLFLLSTFLVLALTPVFFGKVHTASMSFFARLPWGILGILGPIALFFLWFGMWRYWVRIDRSAAWAKRMWFVVLLVGLWWGSCLYCFLVYLPRVYRRAGAEA